MITISTAHNHAEKTDYWFAVDPANPERPFIFGANSADPALPSIACWSAASAFSLENIDRIDGSLWKDWRASLILTGCPWAVPIMEDALKNEDSQAAMDKILARSGK